MKGAGPWRYWRPVVDGYGAAVLLVAAAATATAVLRGIFPGLPGSLFFCAAMLSAWRGGLGPGLLASLLSSAVLVLWLAPLYAGSEGELWSELPRFLMLLFASIFISWLCSQQKRAQAGLQQARDELEQRVSERTRELAASEAKLKEAQRLANIGYWERDLVADRITWSEETFRIFGLASPGGGLSQAQLQELIHPDDRQLQSQALSEALRGGGRYDVEYRIVRPDGGVRFLHVRDEIEYDESGRPIRMFGTVQDITERKRIEDALRERDELMRVLTENANDFIRLHDVEGRSIYASPSVGRLYGRLPALMFDFVHPEDLGACQRWWQQVVAGGSQRLQWRVQDGRGDWRWLETAASRFPFQGRPHVLTVCRDVTDRWRAEKAVRESQHLLELVLATLPVGVSVTDRAGNILLVNAASKRIWGGVIVSGPERWAETTAFWHNSGTRIAPREWASARALTDGRICLNELIDIETYDGEQKTIENSAAPIHNAEGLIVGAVFVNADVTERVRAEEALRETRAELAHITRITTMGELTASIAHEVNQPLTAVVNNANACLSLLPKDAPRLEEVRDALTEIVEDADRASAVIARIRQLARKAPVEKTLVDLGGVITDVLALARYESAARHVTIRADVAEDLPPVLGDPVQLQQVLLNLVANGMDAMSAIEASKRVLVICGRRELREGRTEALVSVRDSGTGLKREEMDRLFEAFYTTKPDGLGMGLAISRSIIEAHDGRLWAESDRGPGATFLFSLPAARERPGEGEPVGGKNE